MDARTPPRELAAGLVDVLGALLYSGTS